MDAREIFFPDKVEAVYQPRRLLFRYYKDRYAAMLLENILQPRLSLRDLRAGRYGRLLDRPALKALAASKGDGWLHRDDLLMLWPCEVQTYAVTFATWGGENRRDQSWYQISRPRRQLVLQLNFPRQHDTQYQQLIEDAKDMPFAQDYHPINENGRNTMAWARIDIDFSSGGALIEEVQTDWIRNVGERLADIIQGWKICRNAAAQEKFISYAKNVIAPHAAMWSEAVLAAAIHVLVHLFGFQRIWFHDFDTGCEVKKLRRKPPRSLYTDLPKQFCFERTSQPPPFILPAQPRWLRRKLERGEGRFWRFDA